MNNKLINVDKLEYINDYRKAGISTFLFALEGYSVGYNTFTLKEIKKQIVGNKYLLINRVLDCNDIDELKKILKGINYIKGIVFEDIGVINIVKELGLDVELILYQNHFNTNSKSVNFWLDRVDSLFISNEITIDEIKYILDNANKEICVNLFGHNQIMYSRRLLLSNWSEEFNVVKKETNVLEDIGTHTIFRAMENEYGTVMYSDKIFYGKDLLDLKNIKYFYINPMLIDHDEVMKFLDDIYNYDSDDVDSGFLYKETIYKLKGVVNNE